MFSRAIPVIRMSCLLALAMSSALIYFDTQDGTAATASYQMKQIPTHSNCPSSISDSGDNVWVGSSCGGLLTDIDLKSFKIIRTIQPLDVRMYPVQGTLPWEANLWFSSGAVTGNTVNKTSYLTEIDANSGKIIRQISSSKFGLDYPTSLVRSGSDVFIANQYGDESLTEINGNTGDLIRVISGKQYGFGFECSQDPSCMTVDSGLLLVANAFRNSVTEINAITGAVVRVLRGSTFHFSGPASLAVYGKYLWVSNVNSSSLTEINVSSGVSVRIVSGYQKVTLGGQIAVSGSDIWMTTGATGLVEFQATTGRVIHTFGSTRLNGRTVGAYDTSIVGSHIWYTWLYSHLVIVDLDTL